ncbi:glycosyltransferase family 4 protein [Devosia sp. ZB163]|uniref:glycosyltransferase family 4 protein n=1 Tax=Devosia sp. ZB163 TaxID=3025938 RepID=UPI00235F3B28|nr:glycosyltransferase family 4 protein [Devosia sp. ZB163]MDC9823044.1 glycosyltransferase family 4 protein [Devosia sp. ZB163]
MTFRVAHLTSAHPRNDVRIFVKQCRSLLASGHHVSLIVADGLGDAIHDGVEVHDVGKPGGRMGRALTATRRVLARARRLRADIYHLHDPELLPAGLALKRDGRKVVFDAHEDFPRQILSKPYIKPALRRAISLAASAFETYACKRIDHVVGATPKIGQKFRDMGVPTTVINNYPLLGELETPVSWDNKEPVVCYVGGVSSIRGLNEVVSALHLCSTGVRLALAGEFGERGLRDRLVQNSGWGAVDELGQIPRSGVRDVMARSLAGIVTFLPLPNHIDAQPNKMFEYMSAGIPVIGSNFPLWRDIIEHSDCGICVDPEDPRAIARAIDTLAANPLLARRLGENGRRAVHQRYNWTVEEQQLTSLYERLLRDQPTAAEASPTGRSILP